MDDLGSALAELTAAVIADSKTPKIQQLPGVKKGPPADLREGLAGPRDLPDPRVAGKLPPKKAVTPQVTGSNQRQRDELQGLFSSVLCFYSKERDGLGEGGGGKGGGEGDQA